MREFQNLNQKKSLLSESSIFFHPHSVIYLQSSSYCKGDNSLGYRYLGPKLQTYTSYQVLCLKFSNCDHSNYKAQPMVLLSPPNLFWIFSHYTLFFCCSQQISCYLLYKISPLALFFQVIKGKVLGARKSYFASLLRSKTYSSCITNDKFFIYFLRNVQK